MYILHFHVVYFFSLENYGWLWVVLETKKHTTLLSKQCFKDKATANSTVLSKRCFVSSIKEQKTVFESRDLQTWHEAESLYVCSLNWKRISAFVDLSWMRVFRKYEWEFFEGSFSSFGISYFLVFGQCVEFIQEVFNTKMRILLVICFIFHLRYIKQLIYLLAAIIIFFPAEDQRFSPHLLLF